MHRHSILASLVLAAVMMATAPAWAASGGRLVVVHQGGKTRTMPLPAGEGPRAKAASAACADPSTLFAFTEETVPSATPVLLRADRGGDVGVRATLTCAALDPISVELSYGVQPIGGQAGYVVNPQARVTLNGVGQGGTAEFRVDVLESAGTADQQFTIRRTSGQFSGQLQDVPMLGSIAMAEVPLLQVTIAGAIMPSQPPDMLSGRPDDPWAPAIYRDLQNFCSAPEHRNGAECQSMARMMADGNMDDMMGVMRALSTERATAIAPSGVGLMTTQIGNVALRISQLLHGIGGGLDASGLALAGDGGALSLGDLVNTLNVGQDDNEEKRTLLGGTRWGLWVNGVVGGGDVDRHAGNSGFKYDNWSLTGGLDYRFTDSAFFGVAAGYSKLSSDFDAGRDRLDADTRALHLYGGYSAPSGLSLDASASWVQSQFDMMRYLPATGSSDLRTLDAMVQGSPDATQRALSVGAGWYLQRDIWTLAPMLQYQWIDTRVDAFEEHGNSIFRLAYARQDMDTRSISAGLYGDVTLATNVGTFRPYGRTLWYSNSGTGAHNLIAEFMEGGAPMTAVMAAEPDRRYSTLELGLGFRRPIGTRTIDFNLGVLKLFGYEDASRWSVRGDVRIPF